QMEQRLGQIRNEISEQNSKISNVQSEIAELRQCPERSAQKPPVPRKLFLLAANIDATDVDIEGDPIAKRFPLRLKGVDGYASRRVNQTLGAMRALGPNPGLMQFTAKTTTNADASLYVSRDKNPFQIQREISLKLLRSAVEHEYPSRPFYSDKQKGELSFSWKAFARITPRTGLGEAPQIEWAKNHIDSLGLDKAKLSEITTK
ncbi:unnamed protein product, partial [Prorocentrum cordatum]